LAAGSADWATGSQLSARNRIANSVFEQKGKIITIVDFGGYRMSKPMEITDATFEKEVLQADKPVVVDFWATWCGPCKMIAPILEEVASEMGEKVKVTKLDVDSNGRTAGKYNIMSIPSLLFFRNGQVVDQVIGAIPKAQLLARLEKVLAQ
jgi:thioredoxin 1